jgi:hypothetical protein
MSWVVGDQCFLFATARHLLFVSCIIGSTIVHYYRNIEQERLKKVMIFEKKEKHLLQL